MLRWPRASREYAEQKTLYQVEKRAKAEKIIDDLKDNASQHQQRILKLHQEIARLDALKDREVELHNKTKESRHKLMLEQVLHFREKNYPLNVAWYLVYSMCDDHTGLDKYLKEHAGESFMLTPWGPDEKNPIIKPK